MHPISETVDAGTASRPAEAAPVLTVAARRRVATAVALGALAAGAWISSVHQMRGASMGDRFSVGSLLSFAALWVVMMAAMMFPSVWPTVALYGAAVRRRARSRLSAARPAAFLAGYLVSWTAYGLLGFGLLAAASAGGLGSLPDERLARTVVAPVALAAALYQLVPLKRACLRHCRGPLSFLLGHWREGARGAVRMGVRHGAYCVGCCWMLMLVLLALGVMSSAWMAVVSLAIAVEKLAPARLARPASGLLTAGLAVLALVALVRPGWLPGVGPDMGGAGGGESTMK